MPQDLFGQLAKFRRARQIRAVACQIDTGQHDLGVAALDQRADLADYGTHRHRARITAAERNDAEGAAVIAAVLHLHEYPRQAFLKSVDEMRRHFADRHDIGDRDLLALGNPEPWTGVDLTSYGADLPGTPKLGLLTKQILRHVPELKRLRISSIDQVEVDRDLLDVIAGDERLMPHLHLSLQSGDDLILKRMKRRHSRRQAVQFCAQVRRLRPGIALGADIIAGFPTETEEMFKRSLDLVEECDLTFLHVFPYSPRPGTPAARMPQVGGDKIRERAKRLRMAGEAALQRRLTSETGATRHVLIESAGQGRTEHFLPVAIADETPGAVRALTITGNDGARLTV